MEMFFPCTINQSANCVMPQSIVPSYHFHRLSWNSKPLDSTCRPLFHSAIHPCRTVIRDADDQSFLEIKLVAASPCSRLFLNVRSLTKESLSRIMGSVCSLPPSYFVFSRDRNPQASFLFPRLISVEQLLSCHEPKLILGWFTPGKI